MTSKPPSHHILATKSRVRTPLSVTIGLCAVIAVAIPALLGLPILAGLGLVIVMALVITLRRVETQGMDFHPAAHVVYLATLTAVVYAVFGLGLAPVLTVYVPALMLLTAAHVLGVRAALIWSAPCVGLVAAGVYAPPTMQLETAPAFTFAVRVATLLTVLVYAVSFRRSHDLQTAALEERATTDPLTGLSNRHELERTLELALRRAERFGRRGAVVFVDLDGMKAVNDRLGHAVGDQVIQELATRIASLTRTVDTTARVGGDEFVILLSEFDHPRGAEIFAQKLLARLREPVAVPAESWPCSASVGIAVFPDCGLTAAVLLSLADEAMYRAKRQGGGQIYVHDQDGVREVAAGDDAHSRAAG